MNEPVGLPEEWGGWFDDGGAGVCPVCETAAMKRYYLLGTAICFYCLQEISVSLLSFLNWPRGESFTGPRGGAG